MQLFYIFAQKQNKKQLYKINLMNIFVAMSIVLSCVSCEKTEAQKKVFIQQNIKKTNEKVAKKHGQLIIPDFLSNENVLADI